MDNRDDRNRDADTLDPEPMGKQTDLAEGEESTVDESIRAHEMKDDLDPKKRRDAA